MALTLNQFANMLSKVRHTSNNSIVACCPAHTDKNPSLAITETNDKLLLKCFSGCSVSEILDSLGLDWDAIMPERVAEDKKKTGIPALSILKALADEFEIVKYGISDYQNKKNLSNEDKERLSLAFDRIKEGIKLANN